MTSKLYSILLLLICTITAQAQEYHVETPGTLQEVIGPGAKELTRIRVTGTLNDRDIAFLHHPVLARCSQACRHGRREFSENTKERYTQFYPMHNTLAIGCD